LKPQTNIILPVTVFTDINKYFYFITVITAISLSSAGAKDNYLKLNTEHSQVWHSYEESYKPGSAYTVLHNKLQK